MLDSTRSCLQHIAIPLAELGITSDGALGALVHSMQQVMTCQRRLP